MLLSKGKSGSLLNVKQEFWICIESTCMYTRLKGASIEPCSKGGSSSERFGGHSGYGISWIPIC